MVPLVGKAQVRRRWTHDGHLARTGPPGADPCHPTPTDATPGPPAGLQVAQKGPEEPLVHGWRNTLEAGRG